MDKVRCRVAARGEAVGRAHRPQLRQRHRVQVRGQCRRGNLAAAAAAAAAACGRSPGLSVRQHLPPRGVRRHPREHLLLRPVGRQSPLLALLLDLRVGEQPRLRVVATQKLPHRQVLSLSLCIPRLRLLRPPLARRRDRRRVCGVRLLVGAAPQVLGELLPAHARRRLEAAARARVEQSSDEELLPLRAPLRLGRAARALARRARDTRRRRLALLGLPLLLLPRLLPQVVLHPGRHVVEPEAKGAGAARVAAGDLPVVVAGVVLERLAAERAAVLGGHAAKVAEAEGAAVHFEALHHEVVVEVHDARVGASPLRFAPRAEEMRLEAAVVGARDGGVCPRRGLGGLRRRLWRREHLKGAHEVLERLGRLAQLGQLVGVDDAREAEVRLALCGEWRCARDCGAEQRQHALGVAGLAQLQNLEGETRRQLVGILTAAPSAGRGASLGRRPSAFRLQRVDEALHQFVAGVDRQIAREATRRERLAELGRLERGGVAAVGQGVLVASVAELQPADEILLLARTRLSALLELGL
mmetsp:Transcript_33802/g.110542  ORF Transcript_33802/g.110542 Transcript_33802/m.110542 type:complete len:528 (+) Transcript_33802:488-2071(+)